MNLTNRLWNRSCGVLHVLCALLLTVTLKASAPDPELDYQAIWKGIYTTEQAERGRAAWSSGRCVFCHGPNLAGGGDVLTGTSSPPVKGDRFLEKWIEFSVRDLFIKIRDTMPRGEVNFISDDAKLDIVAYILKENGFPAGSTPLTAEPSLLEAIRIVKKGQVDVSNFAVVQVTGCLARDSNDVWSLTRASRPVASARSETASVATNVDAQPLGTNTFRLVSVRTVPNISDVQAGHKVQATGLIYRAPGKDRLDVMSLQSVDSTCGN